MVLPGRDPVQEGGEERGLPAAILKEHLEDRVVAAERARAEDTKEVVRRVLSGPDLERQVVVLQDGDGSRIETLRDERLRETFDRSSSRESGADRLEIREHRLEFERTVGAERIAHSALLLSVDLQPERVGCAPDERSGFRWVHGG